MSALCDAHLVSGKEGRDGPQPNVEVPPSTDEGPLPNNEETKQKREETHPNGEETSKEVAPGGKRGYVYSSPSKQQQIPNIASHTPAGPALRAFTSLSQISHSQTEELLKIAWKAKSDTLASIEKARRDALFD